MTTTPLTYAELEAKIERIARARKIENNLNRLYSKSRRPRPRTFAPTVNMTREESEENMYSVVNKLVKDGNKVTIKACDGFTYIDVRR